jgi:hypothetical protein
VTDENTQTTGRDADRGEWLSVPAKVVVPEIPAHVARAIEPSTRPLRGRTTTR